MKTVIASAFLLLGAATAFAGEAGTALDYGTRVIIEPGYETTLDLGYREDPAVVSVPAELFSIDHVLVQVPVLNPEGDRIYYYGTSSIYSVPVDGGVPRLEFESIYLYPYHGKKYLIPQDISAFNGFLGITPDGKKLYFTRDLYEEGSGAEITVTEWAGGFGVGYTGAIHTVECLDLETGAVSRVVTNALGKALSRSGRYLEYRDESVPPSRKVRDLMTGEEWDIPGLAPYDGGPFLNDAFVDNDQNLLYTVMRGEGFALFKIPIRGGDAVQIASVNLPGEAVTHLDVSPDGGTIVFSRYAVGSSGSMENRLYIGDLDTGRITEVLENCTSVRSHSARFTPDGKRIVYVIGNWEKPGDEFKLYIKDVSGLAGTRDEQVSVADDAPKGFALTGNHPNPFNPSTSVSFTIPSAGTVRLTVYDVTGRTVRTMVSSVLPAGAHEMVWDGRDDSGAAVSSGTYIARLGMGSFTASHRMTLIK